jgi:hypothetical protein
MKNILISMSMVAAIVFAGCKEDEEEQPLFTVDATAIEVAAGGGDKTIAVTSNLTWFVVGSSDTWCTASPAAGEGNGTVQLHIAENPEVTPRTATITLATRTMNKTVTVTQAPTGVRLSIDKTAVDAPIAGGNYTVAVTSNTAWTVAVSVGATWCAVYPESGEGNGAVRIDVAENPTPAVHVATITITAGALTKTVVVTQATSGVVLLTDETTIDAPIAGGNYTVAVTGNTTWTMAVTAGGTWCTASPESGEGNGTVRIRVADNPSIAPRTAIITLSAGALTKTVLVTQAASAPTLLIDKTTIAASADGDRYEAVITGNTPWTLLRMGADAAWCTVSPESGEGSGVLQFHVAKNTVMTSRTTTFTISNGTDARTVTVTQAPRPFYAASGNVWSWPGNNTTWSDAIQMPGCNKDDFEESESEPQCRSHTHDGKTYYYYNYAYIIAHKDDMCPSPWKVPTGNNYTQLIASVVDADKLAELWGFGGWIIGSSGSFTAPTTGYYWSGSVDDDQAYHLRYYSGYAQLEKAWFFYGMQFRCVQ